MRFRHVCANPEKRASDSCIFLIFNVFNSTLHSGGRPGTVRRGTFAVRNIEKKIQPCNASERKFSAQRPAQQLPRAGLVEPESEHVHELGDGRLGGHVVAAQHADLLQPQPRFVDLHRDPSAAALRDVEEDDAAVDGLAQHAQEPLARRGVARAVGLEHHGPQPGGREHGPQDLFAQPGEELDDGDAVGQAGGDAQLGRRVGGLQHGRQVVGDVDAHLGQRRVVVRAEGVERLGAPLRRAVGAEQPVLEVERHLGHLGAPVDAGSGDLDRRNEVLASVRAQHADRDLAPGEDHRLGEVLEQEADRRGGVGHRIGAVQYDEAVVARVVVADQAGQREPVRGRDVRGVDHGVHRVDLDVDVQPLERGKLLVDAAEVEGDEGSGLGVGLHADGAARVDDQNGGSHIVSFAVFVVRLSVVERLDEKAHRAESVVAGEHRRGGILHPAVVEARRAVRQRHDEGREGLPGAFAQPLGLLPPLRDEDLPLAEVAGVLDRIFVACDEVPVADLAHDGDAYPFHGCGVSVGS